MKYILGVFYSESEDDDDNQSSWQGSLQSLASISSAGSSISPQTSPAHKRHNLQVIKSKYVLHT